MERRSSLLKLKFLSRSIPLTESGQIDRLAATSFITDTITLRNSKDVPILTKCPRDLLHVYWQGFYLLFSGVNQMGRILNRLTYCDLIEVKLETLALIEAPFIATCCRKGITHANVIFTMTDLPFRRVSKTLTLLLEFRVLLRYTDKDGKFVDVKEVVPGVG